MLKHNTLIKKRFKQSVIKYYTEILEYNIIYALISISSLLEVCSLCFLKLKPSYSTYYNSTLSFPWFSIVVSFFLEQKQ